MLALKVKVWPFRYAVKLASFLIFYTALVNSVQKLYVFPRLMIPLPVWVTINTPLTSPVGAFDLLQLTLANGESPLIILSILFIIGSVFGKIFCGWACPLGFMQELIVNLRGSKPHVSRFSDIAAKKIKYLLLFIILTVSVTLAVSWKQDWGQSYRSALGVFSYGPTIAISPDATLMGTVPKLLTQGWSAIAHVNALTAFKILVLIVFLVGSYSVPLFWCRYLCPLGALMGMFARFSLLGLKRSPTKCERCPHCVRKCPTQVRILELPWEKINDMDCILCLDCVDACPHGAISPKIP